jgi:nitrate/nitrite transporter NarK
MFAILIRTCSFFQLIASLSLMFACQRSQILLLATGKQEASSDKINMILNTLILIGPCVLAIVYPNVGQLAGILGAIGALLGIYVVPTVTYIAQKKTEVLNPVLLRALRLNDFQLVQPNDDKEISLSPKIAVRREIKVGGK